MIENHATRCQANVPSEPEFAGLVDALAANHDNGQLRLTELLREDHPFYHQRGAATVVRMRGWVLLALSRSVLSDAALIFVLEELDTGADAYLVAAAGRALRSYPKPTSALAPFVMRALDNVRYHDQPVSLDGYGEYAISSDGTCAVRELLATLTWLGPHAAAVLPQLKALGEPGPGGLSKKLLIDVNRAIESIVGNPIDEAKENACCAMPGVLGNMFSWVPGLRHNSPIERIAFEDHDGASITYDECFRGHPSIVAFFYTRCDNPLKCSLTVTKLGRIQEMLQERGVAGQIHLAAITYDPGFDVPERLRRYARSRNLRLDAGSKMLRTLDGLDSLQRHFKLGVNFVGSLVNRHRLEVYVLDMSGRIAGSFERLHWDEQQVVDRAIELLGERNGVAMLEDRSRPHSAGGGTASTMVGMLATVGVALFPKCPLCWTTYMSVLGIGALQQIPHLPWLEPLLVGVMAVNLASVWLKGRATGSMNALYAVSAGAFIVALSKIGTQWEGAAIWGVMLTMAGSLLAIAPAGNRQTTDEATG